MAEVGNCGRRKQCHATWRDKVVLFFSNCVLISRGVDFLNGLLLLLYNVLYTSKSFFTFRIYTQTMYCNIWIKQFQTHVLPPKTQFNAYLYTLMYRWCLLCIDCCVTFKIHMNIMHLYIITFYFKTHVGRRMYEYIYIHMHHMGSQKMVA